MDANKDNKNPVSDDTPKKKPIVVKDFADETPLEETIQEEGTKETDTTVDAAEEVEENIDQAEDKITDKDIEKEEPVDDEAEVSEDDPIVETLDEQVEEDKTDVDSDDPEVDLGLTESKTVGEAIEEAGAENETASDIFSPDVDIDDAVDDIVRSESDESIADADAKIAAVNSNHAKKSFRSKLKDMFVTGWENRPLRYGVIAGFVLLIIAVCLLPVTRYAVLNIFGVRVTTSMRVIDSQTRLPLKNIQVQLQDKNAVTDKSGDVSFSGLKLGSSNLSITKRGYADNIKDITLGWGSNPIGEQEIQATGEQFTFILTDWLSNARINNAEATTDENSASSDDDGKIVLTIGESNISDVEVVISAEGYRDEKIDSARLVDGEIEVDLVPVRKNVFVSNRNGKFDIYSIDIDGSGEELLLEATEKEREVPGILPHPSRNTVAIVSSRDGVQNEDGYTLDGLFIVDVLTGESERIGRSEQIQLIGWSQEILVYWQVVEGTSRGNPERSKLFAFNNQTGEKTELASANYFNDVEMAGDLVTYAVSSFAVPQSQAKLYQVKVDGTSKTKLIDYQIYNIFRPEYDKLLFSGVDQKWFEQVGGDNPVETAPVASPVARQFTDSPNREKTAWIEVRDGKGVLLVSTITDFKEQQILSLPGIDTIEYWANDSTIIFRIIKTGETADYVVNIDKPEDVRKIVDVTASKRLYY